MKKWLLVGGFLLLVYFIIPFFIFQFVSGWEPTPELNLGHYYIVVLAFLTPAALFAFLAMKIVGK